jgi:copper oxidase (laccase) domain-containing protein
MQGGGTRSVEYMQSEFATDPSDLLVWLSPSVGRETYPLYDLGNRSLAEVALDQLRNVGIATSNIQIDQRDTAKESLLFSHSEFLKGNRSNDGRQAVVAMMRP